MNIKPRTILTFSLPIILLLLLFILILVVGINTTTTSTNTTQINNFSKLYRNIPEETQQSITNILNDTIQLNTTADISSINDINIREDLPYVFARPSDSYCYGEFTIDIPSIQQSYIVKFGYSVDNTPVAGYSILVSCPDEKSQIYQDSNCKDLTPYTQETS